MTGGGVPAGLTLANWDLGGEPSAWAYTHAGVLFPHVEILPTGSAMPLPDAESAEVGGFKVEPDLNLDEYVATAPVDGIVIVHRGQVVFERYPRMLSADRHLLMSVTKLFTAVLVGILERRGLLDLAQPVDAVIGELRQAGWAGVRIGDILNMASGIDCPELDDPGAFNDPGHPFYRFEASLGWRSTDGEVPSAYDFVAGLPARRPPGEAYEYTSVNTFVLSWLVERITEQNFADVVAREIWSRGGFEAPAQLCVSATGAPVSHGGLSTTLRDIARFGMQFTPSRPIAVQPAIIDDEHLRSIQIGGQPELHRDPQHLPAVARAAYGDHLPPASRQWNFAMTDGDLFKGGFGGQGLYVSPLRDLVIAFAGAPDADGSTNMLRWHSRRIATTHFEPCTSR